MARVQEIGARYEEFLSFFVSLQGDRRDYVMDTYGEQMRQGAERVAGLAQLAIDFTGDESIALFVQKLLAVGVLDLATTQSGGPRIVEGGPIVEVTP